MRPSSLTDQIVDGGVALEWNPPTEDASSMTGYQEVRRIPGEDPVGSFHTIEENTGSTTTSYTDTTAARAGEAYTYRVRAWRGGTLSD